jgi:hypothetical protein
MHCCRYLPCSHLALHALHNPVKLRGDVCRGRPAAATADASSMLKARHTSFSSNRVSQHFSNICEDRRAVPAPEVNMEDARDSTAAKAKCNCAAHCHHKPAMRNHSTWIVPAGYPASIHALKQYAT